MSVRVYFPPGSVLYRPSPVAGADDAAILAAVFSAGATWVQLVAGKTYTFASYLAIPSGCRLSGYGATINSTIATSTPSSCAIYLDCPSALDSGTLASTPAVGGTTISVTGTGAKPSVGQVVAIVHGTSYEMFQILAVSGASAPYTLTLGDDRGISRALRGAFQSGDVIEIYSAGSRPHDILVEGITFTGSGTQCAEVARCLRVRFVDCIFAPTSVATSTFGFDVGGEDNALIRCRSYLSGSTAGPYAQSNIGTIFEDCSAAGGLNGLVFLDCWGCQIIRGRVQGCSGYGVVVGSLSTGGVASFGCIDCEVRDTTAWSCATGLYIVASTSLLVDGFAAESCGTYGILVNTQATSPTADRTRLHGCATKACGTGVYVGSVNNTTIRDHDASACMTSALTTGGDVVVDGFTALSMTVLALTIVSTNARLSRLNVVSTTVAIEFAGTNAWIADSTAASSASVCYYLVAGTLRVSNCKATGSGGSYGVYASASCTANLDGHNDLDGAATPLAAAAGGTVTVSQTGAETAVTVTTADVTLTYAQSVAQGIATSGALTGDHNVIVPTWAGAAWDVVVSSTGGHNTTFKTSAGTGIIVATGKRARVKCDGTNVVRVSADT
jgi:hypothetical protein